MILCVQYPDSTCVLSLWVDYDIYGDNLEFVWAEFLTLTDNPHLVFSILDWCKIGFKLALQSINILEFLILEQSKFSVFESLGCKITRQFTFWYFPFLNGAKLLLSIDSGIKLTWQSTFWYFPFLSGAKLLHYSLKRRHNIHQNDTGIMTLSLSTLA